MFVHWFDWAVYAYLLATLAPVFFPDADGTAGLLAVFAVLAVSFGVRPIGAVLFGFLGDRLGRKQTLSIVILAMTGATLMLGFLPSYGTIGVWAPVLLIVARVIQGLAAGGEFGSAAAFLAESSPAKRRGLGVSWVEVGSLFGFLAASLVVLVLNTAISPEALLAWGWRIPFLLAAPLGIVGFYIRSKLEDTPEFRSLSETDNIAQNPVKEVFTRNRKPLLQTTGIEIMQQVTFYVVLVYLLTYQEEVLGWTASSAALFSTVASIVAVILVPLFGAMSDRYGHKPLLTSASIMLITLSYPLFAIMQSGTPWAGAVSTAGLGVILAILLGVHAVTAAELFPTRTRQSGLSIAYNLASALFAGTVPFVLTWAISVTGNSMFPAFYLMLTGIIGFVTMLSVRETRGIDLLQDDVSAAPTAQPATRPVQPASASARVSKLMRSSRLAHNGSEPALVAMPDLCMRGSSWPLELAAGSYSVDEVEALTLSSKKQMLEIILICFTEPRPAVR